MLRSLETAATGMVAQQKNLDTIANNLANVNTTAFKQLRAEFQDLMYDTLEASDAATGQSGPTTTQIGLGTKFNSTSASFTQGSLQSTGNPLDLAINGDGFFAVLLPDGTRAFTRDGSFRVDANGQVVNSDGYPLEPAITIPSGATALNIAADGTVTAKVPGNDDPQVLGQITIVTFTNPAGLLRMGQNLYLRSGGSGDPQDVTPGAEGSGTLQQRFLEASNVQVVEEMVRMITAQRAYEINSKAIQASDQMLQVVNQLVR